MGKAKKRGHDLRLVNFGCGGETSSSILTRKARCGGLGPGGEKYAGRTQVAAAERFLGRHGGLHAAGADDRPGPLRVIPVAVARVCRLTYYCAYRDIHANQAGHGIVADLVARTLPKKKPRRL